jgi:hypothetical protein
VGLNYVSDEPGSKTEYRDKLDNSQLLSEDVYIIRGYLDITEINKIYPKICLLAGLCWILTWPLLLP